MKTKLFTLIAITGLAGVLAGCVQTVDDRSRAGVPFIKDSVEGRYERPAAELSQAAKEVLAFMGTLTAENTINKSYEGKVNQTSVWVRVVEEDTAKPITKVIVQTRTKAGTSDLDLAHEVEKQIALKLVR